jgi:hypothetical protein
MERADAGASSFEKRPQRALTRFELSGIVLELDQQTIVRAVKLPQATSSYSRAHLRNADADRSTAEASFTISEARSPVLRM